MALSKDELRGLDSLSVSLMEGEIHVHQVTKGFLKGLGCDLESLLDDVASLRCKNKEMGETTQRAIGDLHLKSKECQLLKARIMELERVVGPAICEIDDAIKLAWPKAWKDDVTWHCSLKEIGDQVIKIRRVYSNHLRSK